MTYTILLEKIIQKHDLTSLEMRWLMQQMLAGLLTEAEIAALLVALRCKGESIVELTEAVSVLRLLAKTITIKRPHLVDIVGTGGDSFQTFNISTACCFVVAAAGGTVVKHGNRSSSSKSGAADVLEQAGVNLDRTAEQLSGTIEKLGVGFLFAPQHHTAMAHVAAVRKKLGIRTLFNLLGPLSNPAHAEYHLIGVYDKRWLVPFAEVLKSLSSKKALIVHGAEGLDEISLAGETYITELSKDEIKSYSVFPEQFGIASQSLEAIRVENAAESLAIVMKVFSNEAGPARDIILLNAAAALYAADLVDSIKAGVEMSQDLLASGKVLQLFKQFVQESK